MLTCWSCKYTFKPRKESRQHCPRCGSVHWAPPTFFNRLSWGLQAFWRAYNYTPRHRKPKAELIDIAVNGKHLELEHID